MHEGKGFNTKAFMKQAFKPREAGVEVPDLSAFFPNGNKPIWRVRGLTASEITKASEAQSKIGNLSAVVEALTTGTNKEKIDAIRNELGLNDNVPADIIKRMNHFTIASIDPVITHDVGVKVATVHPIYFYKITNKIMELTGLGQVPGKLKPSGDKTISESV